MSTAENRVPDPTGSDTPAQMKLTSAERRLVVALRMCLGVRDIVAAFTETTQEERRLIAAVRGVLREWKD